MGLLGLTREIITEMKIDVSDHIDGLKKLKGAITEEQRAELEAHEARNEQYESFTDKLNKVKLAMNSIREFGELIWDGYKEGVQDARFRTTAWRVDIEKLSESTHGLVREHDLLAFAAKASRSAFFNSQEDMENAQKAMYTLTQQGREQADVTDAVTNAMNNLKVKGLTDMGIYVDTTKVKFDAAGNAVDSFSNKMELHTRIMEALRAKGAEVAEGQEGIGDSIGQAVVTIQDAWAELKIGLGQLVVAFAPVIDALAAVVKLTAQIAKGAGSNVDWQGFVEEQSGGKISAKSLTSGNDIMDFFHASNAGIAAVAGINLVQAKMFTDGLKDMGIEAIGQVADFLAVKDHAKADAKAARDAAKAAAAAQRYQDSLVRYGEKLDREFDIWKKHHDKMVRETNDHGQMGALAVENSSEYEGAVFERIFEKQQRDRETELTNSWRKRISAMETGNESFLKKAFGPVGDFEVYRKGFEMLSGAMGSMYDAMVSGSEPATQAIKKAIAASVEAVGKQMMIESIKEGAYAIGNLAIGNVAGASAHAAAAAEFAAGAVIAGVVANELGYGGSSAGARMSGSGGQPGAPQTYNNPGSSGSANSQRGQSIIYVYGDSFAEDSPYKRQFQAEKVVSRVLHTSAGSIG